MVVWTLDLVLFGDTVVVEHCYGEGQWPYILGWYSGPGNSIPSQIATLIKLGCTCQVFIHPLKKVNLSIVEW